MAISTATVKAYCDTGFNTVNIPDSPATLQSAASSVVTLETINCLPLSGLTTSITVKSFNGLTTADYVSIAFAQDSTTYYGAIVGYEYISLDTVRIDIILDAWLTCKAKGIQSISGFTKRVHVPKSADTFGAFTEDDPLLVCNEPLELVTAEWLGKADEGGAIIVITSTVDLFLLGKDEYNGAIVYSNTDSGDENKVTVPKVPGVQTKFENQEAVPAFSYDTTSYEQDVVVYKTDEEGTVTSETIKAPCVNYFNAYNPYVIEGIARARGLGADNGILAQYRVPLCFIASTQMPMTIYGRFGNTFGHPFTLVGAGKIAAMTGTDFKFDYSDAVQNKRLLTGDINKYGIIAMGTGSSFEAKPEELLKDGSGNNQTSPSIVMISDPREDGKPYFKFRYINGSGEFFRGLINGATWQNAPLTQVGASGYKNDFVKLRNEQSLRETAAANDYAASMIGNLAKAFGGTTAISSGTHASLGQSNGQSYGFGSTRVHDFYGEAGYKRAYGNLSNDNRHNYAFDMGRNANYGSSTILNPIGAAASGFADTVNAGFAHETRQKQRLLELESLAIDSFTRAPELNFPMIQGLIDFVGNGVVAYRYKPTATDLARLDKVLNAFGYAHHKILELSDFSNRSRYNYVLASGVKINCNGVPKFVREAAEDQIALGIRVWHRKPDNDYATANN